MSYFFGSDNTYPSEGIKLFPRVAISITFLCFEIIISFQFLKGLRVVVLHLLEYKIIEELLVNLL